MLSVDDALSRVLSAVRPVLAERVPLVDAYDRVLAEAIVSPRNVPPWDNSAMDGFAVVASDLAELPVALPVLETIPAGAVPTLTVTAGACSRIMTGAPMPSGADAVVMIEHTDGGDPVTFAVTSSGGATPGQNVRPCGGDVAQGDTVLEPGRVLDPAAVGLISSLGFPSVLVAQRPRVAILSTGDEVVEPGWPAHAGQIYSSNTLTLMGLVKRAGAEPIHCGIAPDDPEGLRAALSRCLRADLVVTTGGVSMGDFDHVKDFFQSHGALEFWKVAMKPGKPLAFGSFGGVPCFGLPGNPVSCMVNFYQFVRPVIRKTLGDPRPHLPVVEARLEGRIGKKKGRAELARVTLRLEDGGFVATPVSRQSSGVLTSMAECDGLSLVPADSGAVEGGRIRVQVLDPRFLDGATANYGWPDHAPKVDHGC
ncbi:MAG: molybdopterin molybdotransferase MoeA [Proteobacteria bacterium]|nr:molybdopterin molybdotransferase MoeA [Pseudomonadota bacterium]MCP4916489.1 molybdopterin molybdotransferase MoeA [Pseudomonadota bacterium]